jgi:hypothetical protein
MRFQQLWLIFYYFVVSVQSQDFAARTWQVLPSAYSISGDQAGSEAKLGVFTSC